MPKATSKDASRWVFSQITAALRVEPSGEDVWDAVVPVLLAAGESEGSLRLRCCEQVWAGLVDPSTAFGRRRVSSMGRWFARQPFTEVFPTIVGLQRVSYYAGLLLHEAPEVFESNLAVLEPAIAARPGWRVDVAHSLLCVDPVGHQERVLRWTDEVQAPELRGHLLVYLTMAYGSAHAERVLTGTREVLDALGEGDSSASDALRQDADMAPYAAYPNSSLKLCLVVAVLRTHGIAALPAVRSYRCGTEGWIVRFHEVLSRWLPGEPEVAALLVAGLFAELPAQMGGGLTYVKYLQRLVRALEVFDVAPHRERIRAHFADADPKVRRNLAPLLAEPPT